MKDVRVKSNTDAISVSKLEKQETTSDPLESKDREQSDTKKRTKGRRANGKPNL